MTQRLIQIGTGNQGEAWCRDFLPPNVTDGTVEVVAAVDVNEDALDNAVEHLDPSAERCYTDAETAMVERDADAVALVVPPSFREDLVDLAAAHDLDVLSEKPLADSMAGALRIVDRVAVLDSVDLAAGDKWGNARLIERFADWCAGGEPMATNARANLQAMALVFAAVESAETGESVQVQEFLAEHRAAVSAAD